MDMSSALDALDATAVAGNGRGKPVRHRDGLLASLDKILATDEPLYRLARDLGGGKH